MVIGGVFFLIPSCPPSIIFLIPVFLSMPCSLPTIFITSSEARQSTIWLVTSRNLRRGNLVVQTSVRRCEPLWLRGNPVKRHQYHNTRTAPINRMNRIITPGLPRRIWRSSSQWRPRMGIAAWAKSLLEVTNIKVSSPAKAGNHQGGRWIIWLGCRTTFGVAVG